MMTWHLDRQVMTLAIFCLGGALALTQGCGSQSTSDAETGTKPTPPQVNYGGPAPVMMPQQPAMPQGFAVKVGDIELSQQELNQRVQSFLAQTGRNRMPPQQLNMEMPNIRQQIADDFINQTLMLDEAERQQIDVTEEDLNNAMDELKAQLPPNKTMDDVMNELNLTETKLKDTISQNVRLKKLFDKIGVGIEAPTEEEIQAYYDENTDKFQMPEQARSRHILFKLDGQETDEQVAELEAKAEGVRKQLLEGADFGELAKKHSACPSRNNGGDLGMFGHGRMVKPFEEAIFSRKLKEIGPLVRTQFGFHIIEVLERNEAGQRSFEEVKDLLAKSLRQQKHQEKLFALIKSLREGADIVYGQL